MARDRRDRITDLAIGLEPFAALMQSFVDEQIDPETFEAEFYRIYEAADQRTDYYVTSVITTFYIEVDSLVADDAERADDPNAISPQELRQRARQLLEEAGLQAPHPNS